MAVALEEHIIEGYEPTFKEIEEFAEWLGMKPDKDKELLWIAVEGLKAPLPKPWRPCQSEGGEIFYFNFETGESTWDHPCDEHYKRLYSIERKKLHGGTLSKDEKQYLQDIGREDLVPSKIATLFAELNDQGTVEVSVLSMGGNRIASVKLKHPYVTFRSVQRALRREAGEALQLVLSDGRMPEENCKKLAREVIELSNADTWPTEPKDVNRNLMELREMRRKLPEMSKLTEVPPLKVTKKHGFRQFGAQAPNASAWTGIRPS